MILSQSWVGYIDRSYEQIKRSCLSRLGITAPEITDHSENNPLIVILSMFSGVAEVIHLYLDSIAREAFIGTARKYASVVKLVKLIDYDIKARNYASTDLLFTLVDSTTKLPLTNPTQILIPFNSLIFPVNSNIPFRVISDTILVGGYASVFVAVGQFTKVNAAVLGVTSNTGDPNQSFGLSSKYVHRSLVVTIDGINWPLFNSFGLMDPTTKGVVVEIDEDQNAHVVFGDGVNGAIPGNGLNIVADYLETEGVLGNLAPGSITNLQSTIVTPAGTEFKITQPNYSVGGTDFEDIDEIRNRAPRSIRTLNRAVTRQDYRDLALQVPGVGAAEIDYNCGKYVDLYISPSSAGVASSALVNKVKNFISCKTMITTVVNVQPAGFTRIWIKATIIGKPLVPESEIKSQVLDALDVEFGPKNTSINREVSVTNIISLVEGLSKVDTINIEEVRIEPYARPSVNTPVYLNITYDSLPHATDELRYTIIYRNATNDFEIYKSGVFMQTLALDTAFNDAGIIAFTLHPGLYDDNFKWDITVFPSYPDIFPDTLIPIDDFSAPIIEVSPKIDEDTARTIFSDLTFEVQGTNVTCQNE
jgi:hypothetical protein